MLVKTLVSFQRKLYSQQILALHLMFTLDKASTQLKLEKKT